MALQLLQSDMKHGAILAELGHRSYRSDSKCRGDIISAYVQLSVIFCIYKIGIHSLHLDLLSDPELLLCL